MKSIASWSELPEFETEQEEARFWTTHQLSPGLMKASEHVPDSRESTTITLRFDPRMLSRIKRIARVGCTVCSALTLMMASAQAETALVAAVLAAALAADNVDVHDFTTSPSTCSLR